MDRHLFKNIRKLNRLSQYEMAAKIEVSRSLVAKIETGNRGLTLDIIKKVKQEFGVKHIEQIQDVMGPLRGT
ncbi:DNA-binding transcriptional regulator, XRE-family HTH domain [Virgibacillus subterraneus]|uniref:DNA-binding transcriptional regulator, XRE-family HTH domain n=1 Tax=Virgibacillus subterraneus TaxID=621109 RepID=A0A1H9EEW3_9BACI|nr:helix-turn-helix transcriptional regulator [Virgibacillus subterraneus]SEQ24221.1 DNA-binding transcriptional regulator, XRE-family HTH domain [Virgibacillus subterraneus]